MNASDPGWQRERQARWRQYAMCLLIGLSGWLCLTLSGAQPGKLFDSDGLRNAGEILSGMAHPDFSGDFIGRVVELSIESLLIGILGTVMAVVLGTSLSFLAITVPDLTDPPRRAPAWARHSLAALRWLIRLVLSVLRSIPEIVWAYIFVRLIGLGPGAAVLAIGLTVGGNIGKLYAELAEAVEPRVIQALRATGASRWAIFLHGVLPQVRRQWTGYALFCLECNIRIGTILGVVGAGGLGSEIALSLRYFQYDKLATTLLAVLAFVVALEVISAHLRQRGLRWSLGFATLGTIWALHKLEIPWGDLFTSQAPALLTFDNLVLDQPFLHTVVAQIGETLMMAWVATLVSACVAFVLAPLAATHLMTGSYLVDPPRTGALSRLGRQAVKWASRALLQGTRVMPELTLALVFVVWVGGGPLAGIMAIAVHNMGVMGRLFADVFEEVESGPPGVLQAQGAGGLATFLFGVLPQVKARLAAFTLYRFEVNVRATAMVGFVGAGGIGDALNTAISLFHMRDLSLLLLTMLLLVAVVDAIGDKVRTRILSSPHAKPLLITYA
ncbi:MAG: ABC transporter permease subunit [Aquabacterium sp.]|uniref:ABC transporter permease subunit n=1 Tax=Aquabacterium sp. TaxID=1872578 RepID=UPI0025C18102|nr:ABC transporter permease subunit [Aquabacterium sp.]MBI5927461.1 ABC transporter permease subunit [Aquabacterium sp.]